MCRQAAELNPGVIHCMLSRCSFLQLLKLALLSLFEGEIKVFGLHAKAQTKVIVS